VLLQPDAGYGRPAATMAGLVAHDVLAVGAELRRIGVPGDGLVWLGECAPLPPAALTVLIARGAAAGLPALLTTTAPERAVGLAERANVLLLHRLADPAVAERYAGFTGEKLAPAIGGDLAAESQVRVQATAGAWPKQPAKTAPGPAPSPGSGPGPGPDQGGTALSQLGPFGLVRRPIVAAQALTRLGNGEHVLIVGRPRRRLVTLGLTVPARIPRHPTKPLTARQAMGAGAELATAEATAASANAQKGRAR
jgi:hypothetical protein